jgi:Zn-dependent protease with chaperone function
MNFFEQQRCARQRTWVFVLLFTLAALAVMAVTDVVVLAAVSIFLFKAQVSLTPSAWLATHPQALVWTSLATLVAIGAAILYRLASLSSGGGALARELGGVLAGTDTQDPRQRLLVNVVEEMAIAAGVPVPDVYVLENEAGINAFAAGFSTSDAAIAVTRGALESLTRDELQGVIAHEFSHILNGDMRLNTRLIGVTFGILVIALTGRMILRGMAQTRVRGSGRSGGSVVVAALAVGVALTVVGYIGVLFARLIKAAVSRSREALADASAVQFTRNPAGLASALKKIAAMPLRATLTSAESEEVSHMLITDGEGLLGSLFASHPPIIERIRALDPRFDPSELAHIRLAPMTAAPAPAALAPVAPPALEHIPISPLAVVAAVGNPGGGALQAAAQQHADMPPVLLDAAHSPQEAVGLVLALVLSPDMEVRGRQLASIRKYLNADTTTRVEMFAKQLARIGLGNRLPLLELAFPALRRRPAAQLRTLIMLVEELLRADGRISVLDYAFSRLLRMHLGEALAPRVAMRSPHPAPKLLALRVEAQTLFSVMALAGNDDKLEARAAYDAGMRRLLPMGAPDYAPPAPWIDALDQALARLDQLPPLIKQQLIEALVLTVSQDQRVTLGEAELLRTVCAGLHCPLPLPSRPAARTGFDAVLPGV